MTTNFELVYITISSKHSNSNFYHHFVIHWLLQNCTNRNPHLEAYQRESIKDKFVFSLFYFFLFLVFVFVFVCSFFFCAKLVRKKTKQTNKQTKNEQNTYTHPPPHTSILKMKRIIFFRRELSNLHEKDTNLHVTITFFLNKGKHEQVVHPLLCP